ncbi:MAG: hypothetical protein GAK31_01854 [Stenotrophomonas maltophilia]|uniref:Uncharacterized protein n=1 Tax=Stenotrophomonas maltophilia TaxID=40324 RepID=A0A7V8FIH6_STEMA|nr:MAG: hypothetical protein GAK31_01854 [Stenotrophomonas maltophilia]
MSEHTPDKTPNPLLELLFGGNMLQGTAKAIFWVAVLCAVLTAVTCL